MRLKKFLTLIIMAAAMILAIPLTASAYTSNTMNGFYITSPDSDGSGTSVQYIKITGATVHNNKATIKTKTKKIYCDAFTSTFYISNFSCSNAYSVTKEVDTGSRWRINIYRNPGHSTEKYTCNNEHTHSGTCNLCGEFTENHFYDNNCDTTCNGCGYVRSIEHDYHEANCLLPKICKVCGEKSGEASGHNFENGYCTVCNTEEESDIMHIKTAEQLKLFAYTVNNGKTNISAVLESDIDVSELTDFCIGTNNNAYSGTFDGNGHKITINLNGDQYSAPFSYTNGANIKNLTTDGSITTSDKFAAGIVGSASGNTKLENCLSFVTINSSVDGDATHGGLVANAASGSLTIDNCAFLGAIKGEKTQNCGGLVGWATVSTKISNSYVTAEFSINKRNDSSNTIARNPGKVTVINCYYVNELSSTTSNTTYALG